MNQYYNPGGKYNSYQMIKSAQQRARRDNRASVIHPHDAHVPLDSPDCKHGGALDHIIVTPDGKVVTDAA